MVRNIFGVILGIFSPGRVGPVGAQSSSAATAARLVPTPLSHRSPLICSVQLSRKWALLIFLFVLVPGSFSFHSSASVFFVFFYFLWCFVICCFANDVSSCFFGVFVFLNSFLCCLDALTVGFVALWMTISFHNSLHLITMWKLRYGSTSPFRFKLLFDPPKFSTAVRGSFYVRDRFDSYRGPDGVRQFMRTCIADEMQSLKLSARKAPSSPKNSPFRWEYVAAVWALLATQCSFIIYHFDSCSECALSHRLAVPIVWSGFFRRKNSKAMCALVLLAGNY